MYKLLLCWRYLRTRYIALASIISVTLGVATLIVVNAVMEGFTHEMQARIHGVIADVVFEAQSLEGFMDPAWHMDQINDVAGSYIEGMTATVVVPAMLSFQFGDQWITRPVQLIGIDEATYSQVGDFGKYLQHPENRRQLSFNLREGGYDTHDHQAGPEAPPRLDMTVAGWEHRRRWVARQRFLRDSQPQTPVGEIDPATGAVSPMTGPQVPPAAHGPQAAVADPAAVAAQPPGDIAADPFAAAAEEPAETFDPSKQARTGAVIGIALASFRDREGNDRFLLMPGDDVKLVFPTAGPKPTAADDVFTIVDLYESKMSEYDSSFVFVPLSRLQQLRGMYERQTGIGAVTSIQIRLKREEDGARVRDILRAKFPAQLYQVSTWRDKQGPLLAAVNLETVILNLLLFLIIAVAGFGILAIFFMIVVEKTRDIGVLKSLGASGSGIQGIFLGYGLSLGAVGAGAGLVMGLLFVAYINEIADLLGRITGHAVFDPSIYYFQKIPTIILPATVTWILVGSMAIAVLASVLPARRAARLHPVEALRYE